MSKVLLISSNLFTSPYYVYPLGMAVIASALSESGHIVNQFDAIVGGDINDRLRKTIGEFSPDFIGISVRNIDNVDSLSCNDSWCLSNEKQMVSLIRQSSDAPVIMGGAAFSALPEEILEYVGADYGVVGEGERAVCELIKALEKGKTTPKLLYGRGAPLDAADMCSPVWKKELIEFYVSRSGMMNLQTKRGCPHNCSYCVYPSLEGNRFRFREPESVIADLKRLQNIYGVGTVFFTDSVFNDPEDHYLELTEQIILSGLKIRWAGYFRPKGIGFKELSLLKRAGLYAMEVGTDAGCDETLNHLKKGFYFEDVLDFNDASIKAEIPSAHFLIFGGPGETEKTLHEGLKNIKMLRKNAIFIYSGIRILPGTDLYRRALRECILTEEAPLLRPVFYFSRDIEIEYMNSAIEKVSAERREFIFPPEKGKRMIDAMNNLGYRGLLWDKMISFSDNTGGRRCKN